MDTAEDALDGQLLEPDETDMFAFASSCAPSPMNFAIDDWIHESEEPVLVGKSVTTEDQLQHATNEVRMRE